MAAITLKSITCNLNYLERMTHDFAGDRTLRKAVVGLQLVLASTLVAVLERQTELLSEKELTDNEMELIKTKQRIPLIKAFRERLGLGLGEAKQKADELFVRFGYGYWDDRSGYKSFIMNPDE
jgi:hypothetical protein